MGAEMTLPARIRRLQDTLILIGAGVIALEAWSLVKIITFFVLFDEATQRELYGISSEFSMESFYITFGVIAFIDVMVRIYVGMSARAEGRGKKKGSAYLVIGVLLALLSVSSIVMMLFGMSTSPSVFDLLMTAVFEAASIAALILMVFCAVRLRRLSRQVG